MEKRIGKLLAGLLMIAMVLTSAAALPIQAAATDVENQGTAEEKKNKVIEVKEITENSIVFAVSEGRVYAIKVKDEKDPTKDVWKWAVETQYDTEAKTVRFEGLTAGTEYEFACAVEETQTPQETEKVCTKAPEKESVKESSESKATESKQPESKVTESKQPESKVTESKEPESKVTESKQPESKVTESKQPESKVTESKQSESKTTESKQSGNKESESKESAGGKLMHTEPPISNPVVLGAPSAPDAELPKPEVLIGKVTDRSIEVVLPEDNSEGYTYSYSINGKDYQEKNIFEGLTAGTKYPVTVKIEKDGKTQISDVNEIYTNLAAPAKAPVKKQATDTAITVEKGDVTASVEENAICFGIYGADGSITWQDTGVFENLESEKEYKFVLGEKSANTSAGTTAGPELAVSTLKAAAEAPEKPEAVSRTDTEIRLKAVQGQEYAAVSKENISAEWNDTGIFSNLAPATEYTFVTRMKYNPDEAMESRQSEGLAVKTKAASAPAPAAPDWSERSETSILLEAVENQEYAVKKADGSWTWQVSPEFTGLNPNTEYTFATRVIFNPDEAMESNISAESSFKTLIPFEGSTITGIASEGSYVSGTRLTATAVGNGMDNVNPSLGDTRWVPLQWNWGQKSFNDWKEPGYSIPFTLVYVGNYRLNVDFVLEEYTENGWTATDVIDTAVLTFKVTEAPPAETPAESFTISATAGANGRINPKGNLTAGRGKDYEFTFLPNDGYVVAKVYIDGVETKVENNKYTFKAVDRNHTISVTFEQAKKMDSPKTGDGSMPKQAAALMILSAVLLIGIFVYNRKKLKKSE